MTTRLDHEIRLLYICEGAFKLPAAPIIRQLVAWEDAPLPDVLPAKPRWTRFAWPESGAVNFERYWGERDRVAATGSKWLGEYL